MGWACSPERVLGKQPKLYGPTPGQLDLLRQWEGCHSPCYKSMICESHYFKAHSVALNAKFNSISLEKHPIISYLYIQNVK